MLSEVDVPPKPKITKYSVAAAAFDLVRSEGADALNARRLAKALGCSTQPIFSNFSSMDELRLAVVDAANSVYEGFLERESEREDVPPYKRAGLGFIRFAVEEPELFKILFMRDRRGETIADGREESRPMIELICRQTGVDEETAFLFHIEMWIFVHGVASMIATGYLEWDEETVSKMMTDVYQGLVRRFGGNE